MLARANSMLGAAARDRHAIGLAAPGGYNWPKRLAPGTRAITEKALEKIRLFGCAGRAH